jgi:hypothetical protein
MTAPDEAKPVLLALSSAWKMLPPAGLCKDTQQVSYGLVMHGAGPTTDGDSSASGNYSPLLEPDHHIHCKAHHPVKVGSYISAGAQHAQQ